MSDLDQLIWDLQSDSAKRRWSTLQKIGTLTNPDHRLLAPLETLRTHDPVGYVRQEASRVLALPAFQTVRDPFQASNAMLNNRPIPFEIVPETPPPSKLLGLPRWVWAAAFVTVPLLVGLFLFIAFIPLLLLTE